MGQGCAPAVSSSSPRGVAIKKSDVVVDHPSPTFRFSISLCFYLKRHCRQVIFFTLLDDSCLGLNMRIFLIHVRDPQFYALPAKTRAKNGRIRVMGFPPSASCPLVGAQTGRPRVCDVRSGEPRHAERGIIEEINRQQPALVGLSFLSSTSYPYAKILARRIAPPTQGELAFGGVFATLNAALVKLQCPKWISSAAET